MNNIDFTSLLEYLKRVPAIIPYIATGTDEGGFWWIKFKIDITHQYAWHLVQELGCVVNYISISERLPTIFYPVSPAPYLNGGPKDFLSWVIESQHKDFLPHHLMEWLEARLPNPVEDLKQWEEEEDDDDDDWDEE